MAAAALSFNSGSFRCCFCFVGGFCARASPSSKGQFGVVVGSVCRVLFVDSIFQVRGHLNIQQGSLNQL